MHRTPRMSGAQANFVESVDKCAKNLTPASKVRTLNEPGGFRFWRGRCVMSLRNEIGSCGWVS